MADAAPGAAAAVCLLVALAGCGSVIGGTPTRTATPLPVPTDGSGGSNPQVVTTTAAPEPPVDPNRTFRRVERLLGVAAARPPLVIASGRVHHLRRGEPSGPAYRLLGLSLPANDGTPAGHLSENGTVVLPGGLAPARFERVLVYHYVLAIQRQTGWLRGTTALRREGAHPDQRLTYRLLTEGTAAYVTARYRARYRSGPAVTDPVDRWERLSPTRKYGRAPALLGRAYVASRVDGPEEVGRVFRSPPTTTEQVLDRGPSRAEPAPLTVDLDVSAGWRVRDRGRQGELLTRLVLETRLPAGQASAAAAGWGNDRLAGFRLGDVTGLVWVLRTDSTLDANQLEPALRQFAADRGNETDAAFAVRRLGPERLVLVAGDETFLRLTSVTATERRVDVDVRRPAD